MRGSVRHAEQPFSAGLTQASQSQFRAMDRKASKWGFARVASSVSPSVERDDSSTNIPRKQDRSPVPRLPTNLEIGWTSLTAEKSFSLASESLPFRRNSSFWNFLFNGVGKLVERTILGRGRLPTRRRSAQSLSYVDRLIEGGPEIRL